MTIIENARGAAFRVVHRVVHRVLVAAALIIVFGMAAGCGGSDDSGGSALPDAGGASSEAAAGDDEADLDPEDAMLKFAQCMRDHGVDVPDPEPGEGMKVNGEGIPEEQMKAAEDACQKWMEMAEPADGGEEMTEEEKQPFLDMAACMRGRGYNFPDPTFDGGRVTQRIEKGQGGDQPSPDDPTFQQDRDECEAEAGMPDEHEDDEDGGSTDEQSS